MKITRFLTFSLLYPTVFLLGCQEENALDCLKSTGKIKTETRHLASFRSLRVFDNLEVTVVEDTAHFVEVTAGNNLLENIRTEVRNGELSLRNINKCNWVRSYDKPFRIRVHTRELQDIFHDGDAKLSSENALPARNLFLHITGAGDTDLELKTETVWLDMYELGEVRLHGASNQLTAYILSMGSLKAEGLTTKEASLKLTDQGQAFLKVSEVLNAEINGPGNVFYRGSATQIKTFGNGSGKVLKLE
jgi:hypothetical protein